MSETCFNGDDINSDLKYLADFLAMKLSVWDSVKFTTTARDVLLSQAEKCNWTSTVGLLQEFCHSHDYQEDDDSTPAPAEPNSSVAVVNWTDDKRKRCTTSKMVEHFYMRLFNFTGMLDRLSTIYQEWSPRNTNDVYLSTIAVGREVGKAVRILFEFQLSDED